MTNKDLIFHVRYPYTAGVLIVLWLGTVLLLLAFPDLALWPVLLVTAGASLVITYVGFVKK